MSLFSELFAHALDRTLRKEQKQICSEELMRYCLDSIVCRLKIEKKKKNTQILFHNIARASEGFAIAVRQIASALEDIPSFRMHRKQSLYSEMFLGVYFTTKHTEGIISAGAGKLIRMPRNKSWSEKFKRIHVLHLRIHTAVLSEEFDSWPCFLIENK